MDELEVVRYMGIAVSLASALWLWGLRRRRLLTWQTGWVPALAMVLGVAADLWPVIMGASFVGGYLLMEFGIHALCGGIDKLQRHSGHRLDPLESWNREDIEFELTKKECWAKSVHRR
jgi:hypothetical protein